jgi:O-antigen/teichoic acid export membrane protein
LIPGAGARAAKALRRGASRFGWGLADQALSSLTNFALGLLVARSVSVSDFGAFSVAFGVYLLAMGTSRALTSEPMVVRFSAVAEKHWRRGVKASAGAALILGTVAGVGCIAAGALIDDSLGVALMALGFFLPGLLLQDNWRFAFFANGVGRSAFVNDLVWAAVLFPAIAFLTVTEQTTVGPLVVAWGASATVAAIVGVVQGHVLPAPQQSRTWLREQRALAVRYLGEFAVASGVSQLTLFGVGAMASLAELGALRAGQILLGPLNILFLSVGLVAIPEGVRLVKDSPDRLLHYCIRLSGVLSACTLLWGAGILLLPQRVGAAFLGPSWSAARTVVVPLSLMMAAFAFASGAGMGLRALAAATRSLRARLIVAPFLLTGGLIGAALAGSAGAAWGLALAHAIGGIVWWRLLRTAYAESGRADSESEDRLQTMADST